MMDIKVNMSINQESFNSQNTTVAQGWVELQGIIKFPVSVRKYYNKEQEKELLFVSYPQRKQKDDYVGVVYPHDKEVRHAIDNAVLEATRTKLFAETVPDIVIDEIRITPLNRKSNSIVQNVGIASVKMCGVTINGLMIKEGKKGLFVQMPQYQSKNGQYHDTVYGITSAIQDKIEKKVLDEYVNIGKNQEVQPEKETYRNPVQNGEQKNEMAVQVADMYVLIHRRDDGYDYSILDAQYHLIDGGVYDDTEITISEALNIITDELKETYVDRDSKIETVDYEQLEEQAEAVEQADMESRKMEAGRNYHDEIEDFRHKTELMFNKPDGQSADDIEKTAYAYIQSKIDEYGLDAQIVDVVLAGSRSRGMEHENSDLDIVAEYKGTVTEDDFFNILHEDGLQTSGIRIDINPITEGKTGTLSTYLPRAEEYLKDKGQQDKAAEQSADENEAQNTFDKEEKEEPEVKPRDTKMYDKESAISIIRANMSERNNQGIQFAMSNAPIQLSKTDSLANRHLKMQALIIQDGKNRIFARFLNNWGGQEITGENGPVQQQIVIQATVDGVPQEPYLYAAYKAGNAEDAEANYKACVDKWAAMTSQKPETIEENLKKQIQYKV